MTSIFIIRYGMRLDHEDRSWKKDAARPFDPPLSEKGFKQAFNTGRYLKDQSVGRIYASPLLRTIQTGSEIVKSLDMDLHIEGGLSEWLNPKWYDYSAGMLPLTEVIQTYPRLNLDYRPLINPRYPEIDEQICASRLAYVVRQLAEEAEKRGENIALLTHGICVRYLVQGLVGNYEGINEQTCVINQVEGGGKSWKLTKTITEHLSWQEEEVEFI